ncbi:MAG TPA: hypothetical protein VID19_10820 [Candidatus Eremiobacteraceae bacterium]|jgi:hypothetical protein
MIVLAHIMAMPVEEVLVPLASGAGAGTVIWIAALLRRFRGGLSQASLEGDTAIGVTGEGVEPLG